ncbi:MAG: hypothetical protein ABIW76_05755 [Fibrobacteria bacterium]
MPIQNAHAIGDQHGVFRSQSTQGAQWTGTAVIEDEQFRITVHPNYLDVELDWVFRVGGKDQKGPEKFQDALEIVGNLNLVRSSVVVGMLTWWKGDILKAKLKTSKTARADYEEVVQRDADAPPPPRDPVLIEYGWGIDNYDISIFPAKFGDTRKVRIHYLIPASSMGGTIKIPYPYAFSDSAKVTIQAGSDIASYQIEAGKTMVPFTNKTPMALSEAEFSFKAYGGSSQAPRVQYIVPVLSKEPEGSRFYVGQVDQPNLKGQAAHIVVMDAQKIISQSNLKEDFVILWRWSHTSVLNAYAGQIVGQSKLLKAFLSKLEGANKRAALIIDKEGGERITFGLSKDGDPDHVKLIAYLDSLASLAVMEPPVVTVRPNYQLAADVKQAQSDFESALQAALNLFDKNENIRHLLVLTAGPQLIYDYSGTVALKVDSMIQVGGLVDYAEHLDLGLNINPDDRVIYWPGINPSSILTRNTLNLEVAAVVTNGNQICSLSVAGPPDLKNPYQSGKSEIEKHVFSAPVLLPKVHWTITQEGKVISEFEETAGIVPVENPLALAQVLGASRALTPMAAQLPRSMAAAVGFVDSTYSLVALEEDKLPAAEAERFDLAGVPELSAADNKALPEDLLSLSSSEWMLENPPQKIWNYGNSNLYATRGFNLEVMDNVKVAVPTTKGAGQAGAFMPMPIAGVFNVSSAAAYPDYTRELSAGILSAQSAKGLSPSARVKGSFLIITIQDLAALKSDRVGSVEMEIFDITGSLHYSERISWSAGQTDVAIPLSRISRHGGLFLMRFNSSHRLMTQKLWLPSP